MNQPSIFTHMCETKTQWDQQPELCLIERTQQNHIDIRCLKQITHELIQFCTFFGITANQGLPVIAASLHKAFKLRPELTPVRDHHEFLGTVFITEGWTAEHDSDGNILGQPTYSNKYADNPNAREVLNIYGFTIDNKLHNHMKTRGPKQGSHTHVTTDAAEIPAANDAARILQDITKTIREGHIESLNHQKPSH